MPEDEAIKFARALREMLEHYPKQKVLAALRETQTRPGPKRKDDTALLVRMGRIIVWHGDLSLRAAAEMVTRHLPDDQYKESIQTRIRKKFSADRAYYLRAGKVTEIVNLLTAEKRATSSSAELSIKPVEMVTVRLPDDDRLEVLFQELRLKLRASCALSEKSDPVVTIRLRKPTG
jgi:hypothetical protein